MTTKTSKTKVLSKKIGDATDPALSTPIGELLNKTPASSRDDNHASSALQQPKIEGVVVGVVQHIDAQGRPVVSIERLAVQGLLARALVEITEEDQGRLVALGFEAGNTNLPIILGFMHESQATPRISGNQVIVESSNGRVTVTAEDELELRCGEAVILMQSDGRITLRGEYITSHASAGQRIRGGSVQIN